MRASVIAEQLGVDHGAVSRLLRSLEGLGLIERHPDEAGGRGHRAALTALGEQRMAALLADEEAMLRRSFRDWPAADIARFADLLGQFNATNRLTDRE